MSAAIPPSSDDGLFCWNGSGQPTICAALHVFPAPVERFAPEHETGRFLYRIPAGGLLDA